MKNLHLKYIIWVMVFMVNYSCEDLIENDMPSDQISTDQVFDNAQTAYAALGGLYASLRDQSVLSGNIYGTGSLLGSYADDLDCYYNDQNNYSDIFLNQQQPTNGVVSRLWNTAYKQIYTANSIIIAIENSVNVPQQDIDLIKGEALVIRSILYFYLQQIFGDIPYTVSLDYETNRNLPRISSEEIFVHLVEDLRNAGTFLSNEYRSPERIYLNKFSADLMLARIYLLQGKYAEAEITATGILNSGTLQPVQNLSDVFNYTGQHIIWQFSPQRLSDGALEVMHFYFEGAPPHAYALTDNLVDSFSDQDVRKSNWMLPVSVGDQVWYRPYKYKNLPGSNTTEHSIVFRLEEVYFILAEALAKQNRVSDALPYLNFTRQRANLESFTDNSQQTFLIELLAEKRREFFTEFGHRFLDLKRLGRLNSLTEVKPNWQEHHKAWPLPLDEMLLNPNLNPQNNGY